MDDEAGIRRPTRTASPVGRRALLGGAGALAATLSLADRQRLAATPNPRVQRPPTADLPLIGGEEFPIGIYWPPPPFETTHDRYQEIVDAGFTFMVTGNYMADRYVLRHACTVADDVGLKMILKADERLIGMTHVMDITDDGGGPLEISMDEARTILAEVDEYYAQHPSFASISFYDEPGLFGKIPTVGKAFEAYRQVNPERLAYTNLARGVSANEENLRDFVELVDPSLISFDHYPLFVDGVDQTWFQDWANVRRGGLTYGLPTWTYILSVPHLHYRAPNKAEMLWQVNVSLAYGCKGIQYFTYWTPDLARGESFAEGEGALMTLDGERTERYDGAKEINTEWLSRVGKQLKPLVSTSVSVAGLESPPTGLPGFEPDDVVEGVSGDAVIIGRFHDPATPRYAWMLVANYALDAGATARLRLGAGVRNSGVEVFVPASETYEGTAPPRKQVDIALEPGAARFYRLTLTGGAAARS